MVLELDNVAPWLSSVPSRSFCTKCDFDSSFVAFGDSLLAMCALQRRALSFPTVCIRRLRVLKAGEHLLLLFSGLPLPFSIDLLHAHSQRLDSGSLVQGDELVEVIKDMPMLAMSPSFPCPGG